MKAREKMEKQEASRRRRRATETLWIIIAGVVLFALIWAAFCKSLREDIDHAGAADVIGYGEFFGVDTPADGVGRAANTTETHGNPSACVVTHGDSLDYNINTTLWGWDGHGAEEWELDLFSRVFYLEFWGTSQECCEAGCDAILNLWDTGLYGKTLFDSLSYYDPEYGYTYRVYPRVWETDYDADGLAWCRALCEERFFNGPEWCAQYFQLGGYHDPNWVTPAYQLDGVFFSVSRWQ